MEVQYAADHDVPVIGFGNDNVYPWIRDTCTVIFDTMEEALDYVIRFYEFG